jgi:phage-related protein
VASPNSIDIKEVVCIGSAESDLDALPKEVRTEAHAALSDLQNGRWPAGDRYSDITGNDKLTGVGEIRLNHDKDTYRVYNVVSYKEVLYVLEAGIKKSVRGGAIPQQDVKRLEKRCKAARDDYKANLSFYQARYLDRERKRDAFNKRMEVALRPKSPKPKGT